MRKLTSEKYFSYRFYIVICRYAVTSKVCSHYKCAALEYEHMLPLSVITSSKRQTNHSEESDITVINILHSPLPFASCDTWDKFWTTMAFVFQKALC